MLTPSDESAALAAVVDLLQCRVTELFTMYCARNPDGGRRPSYSHECAQLLGTIDDMLAKESVRAESMAECSAEQSALNELRRVQSNGSRGLV